MTDSSAPRKKRTSSAENTRIGKTIPLRSYCSSCCFESLVLTTINTPLPRYQIRRKSLNPGFLSRVHTHLERYSFRGKDLQFPEVVSEGKLVCLAGPLMALNAQPWLTGNYRALVECKRIFRQRNRLINKRLIGYNRYPSITLAVVTAIHCPEPFLLSRATLIAFDFVHNSQRCQSHRHGSQRRLRGQIAIRERIV